ncbi:DinB family protein [Oceanobacillus massiliensis]|uniref:DinB family protein n=1 Tax=Oceanobacillus massiliensis TaxID=1465765 RepID=UPI0002885F73|nr:DinB family protein [Oceanobacillus massiliensis]
MNSINQLENITEEFLGLKSCSVKVLTEPISEGKWAIREIVGHLFYWDKFNLDKMIPLMADGAVLPPFPNHDLHNEEAVAYLTKYEKVSEIIDDFVKKRKQLVKELKELDNGIQFQIENEPNLFSAEKFAELFLEHDIHHLNQIKKKLEK